VEASPTSAYAWLRRGIAHHNLGDLEAGLADFRRALEEAKDTSERAQPLGRIAWASLRLGDDETAKAETELLLRDHGDDPWVLAGCSGMGWLLGEQEFTVRAERLAISAEVNPITIAAIRGTERSQRATGLARSTLLRKVPSRSLADIAVCSPPSRLRAGTPVTTPARPSPSRTLLTSNLIATPSSLPASGDSSHSSS
jgi:hypothetical protein